MADATQDFMQAGYSGLPFDPVTMDMVQQQRMMQAAGPSYGSEQNRAAQASMQQGMFNLSPQAQQAQEMQAASQRAIANLSPQADHESDLDYQIRQLHAVREAVAPYSPEAALSYQQEIAKRTIQQQEQARLNEHEADMHAEHQRQQTIDDAVGIPYHLVGPDNKPLGDFNLATPEGRQAFAKAQANAPPGSRAMNEDTYNKWQDTMAQIAAKAKDDAEAKKNALLNLGIDADDANEYAAQYATGWAGRMSAPERALAMHTLRTAGVTLGDQAAARADISALQSGARAIGQRQANIGTIEESLGGLGDQAVAKLAGLNQTDLKMVNRWLNAGRAELNEGPVYQAFLAVQALRTEYARLLRGGSIPDDQAMREAEGVIPNNLTSKAMGAIVDQIRKGEVPALKNGSDLALDAYSNPNKWKGLTTLASKLRLSVDSLAGDNTSAPSPTNSPTPSAATQHPDDVTAILNKYPAKK